MTYETSLRLYLERWKINKPNSVDTKMNTFLAQESLLLGDLDMCAYYLLLSLCKTTRSIDKVKRELKLRPKLAQLYYNVPPAFRISRVENYITTNPMLALQILVLHLAKETIK